MVLYKPQLNKFQFGGRFKRFDSSLPENLKSRTGSQYNMKLLWRKSGRPETFNNLITKDPDLFTLEEDGYHAPTVEPITGKFLKSKKPSKYSKRD